MIQQIALCLLVAVAIVMVSAPVSDAWHHSCGCGRSHGNYYGRSFGHIHHRPIAYRHYEFHCGYWNHHFEYERMRAMYGFINL